MNFLKIMKTRERVEMLLKAIVSIVICIIFILLMEGMIFNIYMTKINENQSFQYIASTCIAYCEEVGDDEYKIYLNNIESGSWSVRISHFTKEQITDAGYANVIFRAPNAFDVSIKSSHYVIIAMLISAILIFYGWRFYNTNKVYKKLVKQLALTGSIF